MLHTIVPAGKITARWMYVTRIEGAVVWGRLWSARSGKWTTTETWYSNDALHKLTPRCPKPKRPQG